MQHIDISSAIPLLLAYPTVILASHLVLAGNPASPGAAALRLVLLPLFAACSVCVVGLLLKLWGDLRSALSALVLAALISQLNFALGTVQTTALSLVTIKLVLCGDTPRYSWSKLLKVYLPLCLLSAVVAKLSGASGVLPPLMSYLALVACLKVVLPRLPKGEVAARKKSVLSIPLVCAAVLYVACLSYGWSFQLLMVFVFGGCLVILLVSARDLAAEEQKRPLTMARYFIVSSALMAVVLQFLSFNAISSSRLADCVTIVYAVYAEYVSWSVDIEPHGQSSTIGEETPSSLFQQIAKNKDTRSIFSFLLLNTTFMFVQLLYSFRSKSLGLLSDSLHMALDCTSLLLGLIAGVLAKRPPSDKFPFAMGFLETLAGFTNAVLLLGIVCGIFVEALGRLFSPVHLHKTSELLVVATLGLIVNLAGLFAFDHGGHSHGGSNENMRGIFLHILADTLGSVGVIVSTILIKVTHLHIFDPIASIFIGSLILLSAIPLLKSTTSSILLKLDEKKHNAVKNALNQISATPGITGYTTPRFWPATVDSCGHSHAHSHAHSHDHSHEQAHCHEHSQGHIHADSHDHSHASTHEHSANTPSLVGYIHIQYNDGENSTIIKKRAEKIFESVGIKAWIQVEPNESACWCRTSSQNMIPQVVQHK
ncbi:hypothetical protein HG536_0C00420 [Torulaspora globosa]|uniref:Zinc transporter n=1 Tax=Torulaspora globosa TaxID=48254 RepID=A0A7G3ZED9_9SACH|nr:uncharacterized protein HG536_0C00420 [Torulaspora globosa]QLL31875.1 hypothetical protein HG536_0C00420 [Torulaspora globosa]